MNAIFMLALLFSSLILVLLILVQRGKGGGLAGALGGMGGQSAFGAKAGDTFTRITIGVALLWFILCLGAVAVLKPDGSRFGEQAGANPPIESNEIGAPKGTDEGAGTTGAETPAETPVAKPEKKSAE